MSPEAAPFLPLNVSVDFSSRVNFAFQQNAIPILRRVEIRNEGISDLRDVVCTFVPSPDWAKRLEVHIDRIAAGTDHVLVDLPLDLNLNYLAELSDRVRGEIIFELRCRVEAATDAETVYTETLQLDVFAHDEWTGLSSLPEILAAFVTPNIAAVETLLGRTAILLGQRTGRASLEGYQAKNKQRVFAMLDCIYDALREVGIHYSSPPASFERSGQRVRFGEQIIRSKLGTCLDLSLLFASVMEQAGLRPLVLMHEGHAYPGCWLVEESFPEPSWDTLQDIRKRVELEEIVVFESTLCCDGNGSDFMRATLAARPHLNQDAIFHYAIDVYRSRASGIRPLPIKRGTGEVDLLSAAEAVVPREVSVSSRAARRQFVPEMAVESLPKTPEGRIDHWKQQLLDLTLRNRLLNFRETKQTIPLVCAHPEHLEDELAANKSFSLLGQSKLMSGLDPRSFALQASQFDQDPVIRHLEEELHARRLRSSLTELEINRRLLELYRRSRFEMEESGANTLYLALGFLEWKETPESDRTHRAPILLIPVKLERKSVHQGFSVQRYDEDAMINVTLLELLKRDCEMEIPGVNPPPEDESGVDVAKVFWLFQQAVKDMPGWEVHREVWIAQFSFSKFLLWKDLNDRISTLSANPVIHHLVNRPGEAFLDGVENISATALDQSLRYEEIFCPVSADSSQLAAVVAAAQGKNFVMHGPPGTGKSQTITNLIAHCLALGKRVLFVAEKRAALEVVHKRLSQIGLGPFCLELHSNKTGKAEVLNQFGEAMDFADQQNSEEWRYLARQLEASRNQLNHFVAELHRIYPNRMSAYHCYAWLMAHRDRATDLDHVGALAIDDIDQQSREHYEELLRLCDDLQIRGSARRLSSEAKDALRPFGADSWTPEWEDALLASGKELSAAAQSFEAAFDALAAVIGLGAVKERRGDIEHYVSLGAQLIGSPVVPSAFVEAGEWRAFRSGPAALVLDAGRRRDHARSQLLDFDLASLLALDLEPLRVRFEELSLQGGMLSRLKKHLLLKPIRRLRKQTAGKWTVADAPHFFEMARELQTTQAVLDQAGGPVAARVGNLWNGGEVDWDQLSSVLEYGDGLHAIVAKVAGDHPDRLLELRSKIGRLLPMADDLLAHGQAVAEKAQSLAEAWERLERCELAFRELARVDPSVPLGAPHYLGGLAGLVERLYQFRGDLQNWCRWQHSRNLALLFQLEPLIAAVEQETLGLNDLRFTFEMRYRENFLRRLISSSEALREFYGDEHQVRIDAFNDLDHRYTALTAQAVVARLAAELPRARRESCPRNTELGILQRERAKKARHKPVRKLFSEIPNIAAKLKPCFLMSPLSVAQYLDVEQDNFDLVVFDEASQIPVWDAVGAIARGKQMVIVGDPKQLPPTNFFGRSENDETTIDDGTVQDLESILDECLGSGLDIYNLRWHYRSRQEGLIAFSNHHYYDNLLHTFPAPHAENIGVRLEPVPNGYYDKGKSRTNPGEAAAITEEVIRRLKDPLLSRLLIGIVTFSQAQQTLILDKLDQARRDYPEIEGFFGDETEEPVFVKNLENVQGDERDVIILSVCYGPDQAGKVSMNFGPLNRSGGERRLNVAVTRAKHEIIVFSTLRSEQIDLSRTRAKGAEHLKAYLEYAERGARALATTITSASQDEFDSVFEKQVAELLRSHGYEVHTQVGCSGYRIDLAIVAPDLPGRYVLGIECDGASYHRSATARDRDGLRQAVLESLGWKMHRIWSTDWWRSYAAAAEELLRVVEEAIVSFKAKPASAARPTSLAVEVEPVGSVTEVPDPVAGEAVEETTAPYASQIDATPVQTTRRIEYVAVSIPLERDQEAFYGPNASARLREQMNRIVAEEGPIVESLLIRRVTEAWGFSRAGERIREILARALPLSLAKSRQGSGRVYWPESLAPSDFHIYRSSGGDPRSQRSIDEIPREELGNAALEILEMYVSFPQEDLRREVIKRFGISRLTKNIAAHVDEALQGLVERGVIERAGDLFKQIE